MTDFLYLGLGLLFGGIIGWLIGSRKPPVRDERLEQELRRTLNQREEELSGLREELSQTQHEQIAAEQSLKAAEQHFARQSEWQQQQLEQFKQQQAKALQDLRDTFQALSTEALRQTQPEFLRLANETLSRFQEQAKGELVHRQEAIQTLVKPLEEQLKAYQQRFHQSETAQAGALGEVKKQLETLSQHSSQLSQETYQLRRILSSSQARGRWGEETLRRIIETSGLSSHCDFSEQAQAGDSKPDLIVHLPGNRMIIVDAKVPELEFLEGLDSADNTHRSEALKAHAQKLKSTVKALADRDYPNQFPNALDHVVLFVPAESLFSAALEGDSELILWAQQRRILIATPASLIGLLRAVSLSWQQHHQTENARQIIAAAEELYSRICKFTEHLERLRSGLDRANEAFNDAVGSFERSVRPSGERLVKLGASDRGRAIAELPPLDTPLRPPSQD